MEVFHPVDQKGITQHFFFGNIAGGPWHPGIGQQDVKITAVVPNIQYRRIFWHIFFPNDSQGDAAEPEADAERPVDDGKGTSVFQIHIKFSKDPFHNQQRDAEDKE